MKTNNIRIHLIIATFILFKSWIAAIEVQNQNINNSNKSDELTCRKTFEYDSYVLEHCYNDFDCMKYGDCCRDSKYYNESEQTVAISGNLYNNGLYGCSGTGGKYMLQALMINRCPKEASLDWKIRDKCEGRADDFLSANPVSSNYSEHVYKNIWCAWCNGEREQVDFRRLLLFRCQKQIFDFNPDLYKGWLRISNGQWYYFDYREQNTTLTDTFSMNLCEFRIKEIHATSSFPTLRNCVNEGSTEIVDGCPNGTSAAEAKACASHTYIVFENQPSSVRAKRVFRNADCARCNGLTVSELSCEPTKPLYKHHEKFGFFYYDVAFSKDEYDKYTIDNWTEYVYSNSTREDPTSWEMGAELIYLAFKDKKELLNWIDNVTVTLSRNESDPSSPVMHDVIFWGIRVSAAALIAHLLLFVWDGCRANSEPKNLPEKNLASLSVALLISYVGVLIDRMYKTTSNSILNITIIFGLLPAFGWMFVMSIDIWLVLDASTNKLRVVGGQRYGRFVVYSLFAWLWHFAIFVLSLAIQVSLWDYLIISPNYYGHLKETCWSHISLSQVVHDFIPIRYVSIFNCLVFFDTIRLIFAFDKSLKSAVSSDGNRTSAMVINRTRRNIKCLLRLSLIMGPTWMFALFGIIYQSDIVCLFNTTLNSLQGAFIFFAFDCNQDTLHKLAVFRKHTTASETQNTTTNNPFIASTQIE